MSRGPSATAQRHEEVRGLLPWFVNRTLDEEEAGRVAAHLADCSPCAREEAHLRGLAQAFAEAEEVPLAPQLALARLMPRINGAEEPRPRRLLPALARLLPGRSAIARGLLVAQTAALLLIAGLLLWDRVPQPQPAYRTLADEPVGVAASGVVVRVVFAPGVDGSEIRRIVRRLDGEIVAGPSPAGVYTVELPSASGTETARSALERLRAEPAVALAEPVAAGGVGR